MSNCRRRFKPLNRLALRRILAEPTVTAVTGESAKFLAGGTIPIPNGETARVEFVSSLSSSAYGVTLNFTPIVLSQGVSSFE